MNLAAPAPAPQALRAGLWMLGAVASFSSMAVAGRAVSFELDTFEIMMYRSIVGFVLVLGVARLTGQIDTITTRSPRTHIIRNLCHFTGQNLWFYAITVIPLAQVFALEFTAPLWVLILSPLVLGERLTGTRALAAVIGFAGILIVARPSPETLNMGTIAAAAAAIGFAGSIGYDGDIALPSLTSAPWLVLIGCAGLLAHFCLTTALSLAPATLVTPVDFLRLPVIAIIGILVYAEPVDAFVIVGAIVIFGANYLNLWRETRKSA